MIDLVFQTKIYRLFINGKLFGSNYLYGYVVIENELKRTVLFTGQLVVDQSREAHVPEELEWRQGVHGQRAVSLPGLGRRRVFATGRTEKSTNSCRLVEFDFWSNGDCLNA